MEFKKIIAGAIFYVLKYRTTLLKALALPFIAYLGIDAISSLELDAPANFLISIVSIIVQAIFAITTHRIILLGPDSVSKWGITSWTKRETLFVVHMVGLGLVLIPIALLGIIPVVGAVVAIGAMCWLVGRLSLVFPGIAVDKGVTFTLSWELTQDHQLLMLLVVAVLPALLAIPLYLLDLLSYTFAVSSVLSTFAVVFEVAALSMAYHLITGREYEKG